MWLITIRNFDIYILNVINIEIIKLMEIYTVFWNRERLSNYWRYILFLEIDLH